MRRLVAPAVAALLIFAAGIIAGLALRRAPPTDARSYATMRLVAVQVALDEAPPEYDFLAGDSQTELQPGDQQPCGLPWSMAASAGRRPRPMPTTSPGSPFRYGRRRRRSPSAPTTSF
ncbi:hypothetical protein ACFQFG_25185 [Methylobacterium persicinum]